VTVAAKIHF